MKCVQNNKLLDVVWPQWIRDSFEVTFTFEHKLFADVSCRPWCHFTGSLKSLF